MTKPRISSKRNVKQNNRTMRRKYRGGSFLPHSQFLNRPLINYMKTLETYRTSNENLVKAIHSRIDDLKRRLKQNKKFTENQTNIENINSFNSVYEYFVTIIDDLNEDIPNYNTYKEIIILLTKLLILYKLLELLLIGQIDETLLNNSFMKTNYNLNAIFNTSINTSFPKRGLIYVDRSELKNTARPEFLKIVFKPKFRDFFDQIMPNQTIYVSNASPIVANGSAISEQLYEKTAKLAHNTRKYKEKHNTVYTKSPKLSPVPDFVEHHKAKSAQAIKIQETLTGDKRHAALHDLFGKKSKDV
jgi:hypothetical protein